MNDKQLQEVDIANIKALLAAKISKRLIAQQLGISNYQLNCLIKQHSLQKKLEQLPLF